MICYVRRQKGRVAVVDYPVTHIYSYKHSERTLDLNSRSRVAVAVTESEKDKRRRPQKRVLYKGFDCKINKFGHLKSQRVSRSTILFVNSARRSAAATAYIYGIKY